MAVFRRRQILLLDTQATYQATVLGIAQSSLLAYWPLTETSGTQASDVSGNARHGTYSGVTLAQIAGAGGSMGSAGLWDGINDNCNVFSASLDAAFNKNLHTIAGWGKVANAGVWTDTIFRLAFEFSVTGGGGGGVSNASKYSGANTLRQSSFGGGTGNTADFATSSVAWIHMALVVNGTQAIPYVNAAPGATITRGTWAAAFTAAALGSRAGGSLFWSGYLAHFAVWNAALTPAQITTLATAR